MRHRLVSSLLCTSLQTPRELCVSIALCRTRRLLYLPGFLNRLHTTEQVISKSFSQLIHLHVSISSPAPTFQLNQYSCCFCSGNHNHEKSRILQSPKFELPNKFAALFAARLALLSIVGIINGSCGMLCLPPLLHLYLNKLTTFELLALRCTRFLVRIIRITCCCANTVAFNIRDSYRF